MYCAEVKAPWTGLLAGDGARISNTCQMETVTRSGFSHTAIGALMTGWCS